MLVWKTLLRLKGLVGLLSFLLIVACGGGGEEGLEGGATSISSGGLGVDVTEYCGSEGSYVDGHWSEDHLCLANPESNASFRFNPEGTTIHVSGLVRLGEDEGLLGLFIEVVYLGSDSVPYPEPVIPADTPVDESGNIDFTALMANEEGVLINPSFSVDFTVRGPGPYQVQVQLVPYQRTTGMLVPLGILRRNFFVVETPRMSLATDFQTVVVDDEGRCEAVSIDGEGSLSLGDDSFHHESIHFCVSEACEEGTVCPFSGPSTRIAGVNRILSVSGSEDKVVQPMVFANRRGAISCGEEEVLNCNGILVSLPLGQGENQVTLYTVNEIIEEDCQTEGALLEDCSVFAGDAGNVLEFSSVENALRGPDICVTYVEPNGHVLGYKNGKPIVATNTLNRDGLVVDVTLSRCPLLPLETLHVAGRCPKAECDDESKLCLRQENEEFIEMCDLGELEDGVEHYQYFIPGTSRPNGLRFPNNVLTIRAKNDAGVMTEKVEAFGYGLLDPVYQVNDDEEWTVDPSQQVPNSLGVSLSSNFLRGDVAGVGTKGALETLLNSETFKHDIFFNLLRTMPPSREEEAQCPQSELFEIPEGTALSMKFYPFDERSAYPTIGNFEVLEFTTFEDTVWVRLHLDELRAGVEVFSVEFQDKDGDGAMDLKDADADGDGICDSVPATAGVCHLKDHYCTVAGERVVGHPEGCIVEDEFPMSADDDADAVPDILDQDYADEDDDNDEILDKDDIPGAKRVVRTNLSNIGLFVLPIKLQADDLYLNIQLKVREDSQGRVTFEIDEIPSEYIHDGIEGLVYINGFGPRSDAVRLEGERIGVVGFDCDRQYARTNNPNTGRPIPIDQDQCRAIAVASNGLLNNSGLPANEANGGVNQLLASTMSRLMSCNTPIQLKHEFDKFRTQKFLRLSMPLFGKDLVFDTYADALGGDIEISEAGIGVKAPSLVLTAGAYEAGLGATAQDATAYMQGLIPTLEAMGIDLNLFGPLRRPRWVNEVDPVENLRVLEREVGIALNEEMLNMLIHASNVLLLDLSQADANFLAIDQERALAEMGMGFSGEDAAGVEGCFNADGVDLGSDNPLCSPVNFNYSGLFGGNIFEADLNSDGNIDNDDDGALPITLALGLNPHTALTVRLLDSSAVSDTVRLNLEVSVNNAGLLIYPNGRESGENLRGNWCDAPAVESGDDDFYRRRYFPAEENVGSFSRGACADGRVAPILEFALSGRLTLKVEVDSRPDFSARDEDLRDFVIPARFGLKERPGETRFVLDQELSYMHLNVVENNTHISDNDVKYNLSQVILPTLLSKMVFGGEQMKPIKLPIHFLNMLRLKVQENPDVVSEYLIEQVEGLGVRDVELQGVTPNITIGSPQFLGIGLDLGFCYLDHEDTCR